MNRKSVILWIIAVGTLSACAGTPSVTERAARDRVAEVGEKLRPAAGRPTLPVLQADAAPETFVLYGVLNHPSVAAAYYDWAAAVQGITRARSLPDPTFTFEADVADTLMTLMPGLMFDVMAPGKRAAMGLEAAAMSEGAYRTYVATVLRVAAEVRKSAFELAYIEEARRLYIKSIESVDQAMALSGAEYVTGRNTAGLQQQVRLQTEAAEHHAHHAALGERLVAARVQLKAALGLSPADADPPWPTKMPEAAPIRSEDELWRMAQAGNPELARMRAMVDSAIAGVEVARRAGTPDFSIGAMADVKADPLMVRPTASITLPIWRAKIAATVAAAQARREAAAARLSEQELTLAAEIAQLVYQIRESDRMIGYIDRTALPNLDRAIAMGEAGYQSGMGSATLISESQLAVLTLKLQRLDALRERERAAIDLSAIIATATPSGTPLATDRLLHPSTEKVTSP